MPEVCVASHRAATLAPPHNECVFPQALQVLCYRLTRMRIEAHDALEPVPGFVVENIRVDHRSESPAKVPQRLFQNGRVIHFELAPDHELLHDCQGRPEPACHLAQALFALEEEFDAAAPLSVSGAFGAASTVTSSR